MKSQKSSKSLLRRKRRDLLLPLLFSLSLGGGLSIAADYSPEAPIVVETIPFSITPGEPLSEAPVSISFGQDSEFESESPSVFLGRAPSPNPTENRSSTFDKVAEETSSRITQSSSLKSSEIDSTPDFKAEIPSLVREIPDVEGENPTEIALANRQRRRLLFDSAQSTEPTAEELEKERRRQILEYALAKPSSTGKTELPERFLLNQNSPKMTVPGQNPSTGSSRSLSSRSTAPSGSLKEERETEEMTEPALDKKEDSRENTPSSEGKKSFTERLQSINHSDPIEPKTPIAPPMESEDVMIAKEDPVDSVAPIPTDAEIAEATRKRLNPSLSLNDSKDPESIQTRGEIPFQKADSDPPYSDSDFVSLESSMANLQKEIDGLKKDLGKKQDKPNSDNKFTGKIGGAISMDAVAVTQDDDNKALYGDIDNQFGFRDIRLTAKGEGYKNLSYEVCVAFNNGISFKNMFMTVKEVPVLDEVRLGYMKVESGISYNAFLYNSTFVDWDPNCRTFQMGRRLGLASVHFSQNKNIRFFTGIFTGQNLDTSAAKENSGVNTDNAGLVLNTRLSGLPIYRETEDGQLLEVLHVGGSFRWVDPGKDRAGALRKTNLRSYSPAMFMDVPYLLTGGVPSESVTVTNAEIAWQKRQMGVIAESYVETLKDFDSAYGFSLTGRYLLTPGAWQTYNKGNGTFGEVNVPENLRFIDYGNLRGIQGLGAWEIAGQWAWTDLDNLKDLNSPSVYYGQIHQFLFALNWYWNHQTRVNLNWIHAIPDSATATDDSTDSSSNDTFAAQFRFVF